MLNMGVSSLSDFYIHHGNLKLNEGVLGAPVNLCRSSMEVGRQYKFLIFKILTLLLSLQLTLTLLLS